MDIPTSLAALINKREDIPTHQGLHIKQANLTQPSWDFHFAGYITGFSDLPYFRKKSPPYPVYFLGTLHSPKNMWFQGEGDTKNAGNCLHSSRSSLPRGSYWCPLADRSKWLTIPTIKKILVIREVFLIKKILVIREVFLSYIAGIF